jgi:hypothetical protein
MRRLGSIMVVVAFGIGAAIPTAGAAAPGSGVVKWHEDGLIDQVRFTGSFRVGAKTWTGLAKATPLNDNYDGHPNWFHFVPFRITGTAVNGNRLVADCRVRAWRWGLGGLGVNPVIHGRNATITCDARINSGRVVPITIEVKAALVGYPVVLINWVGWFSCDWGGGGAGWCGYEPGPEDVLGTYTQS